jgi:hypothetical protein
MLLRQETLDGIVRGEVTLAFRRWKRPTVKSGGRQRTSHGAVRIGAVDAIDLKRLTEADARASGFASLAALKDMLGSDNGDPVYRIELTGIEPDERVALRDDAELSEAEWAALHARFERWNRTAPGYFPSILALIRDRPAVVSTVLAQSLGAEKLKFKQDVRKLKELGLTESLEVGYRLSPRGLMVLKRLEKETRFGNAAGKPG